MKYLLIDFGASNFKSVIYDTNLDRFFNPINTISLFQNKDIITKEEFINCFSDIVKKYNKIDKILTCSILGGYYVDDVYYSWKCKNKPLIPLNPRCLVHGIFDFPYDKKIHKDQAKSLGVEGNNSIEIIGYHNEIPVLSNLGDTECALSSIKVKDKDMIINLGTGSQVVYKDNRHSFIPSGRALLVFDLFFKSLDKNTFFEDLSKTPLKDILQSTLKIDLNVFSQSSNFKKGGFIKNILEENFNYKNLLSSILKSYLEQYEHYIQFYSPQNIYFIGGISQKLNIINEYFKYKYPNINIKQSKNKQADTHLGMVNIIKTL